MRSQNILLRVLERLAPRKRDDVVSLGHEPRDGHLRGGGAGAVGLGDLGEGVYEDVDSREVGLGETRDEAPPIFLCEVGGRFLKGAAVSSVCARDACSARKGVTYVAACDEASARRGIRKDTRDQISVDGCGIGRDRHIRDS